MENQWVKSVVSGLTQSNSAPFMHNVLVFCPIQIGDRAGDHG